MPPAETLASLAALVGATIEGDPTVTVLDVTHDSRQAGPGTLFVAVRGFTVDGHDYVESALRAGASAVVVERALDITVPQLIVADSRAVLGRLAAAVHGDPSRRVPVVGVTGTNGKTSVTFLIESIARAAGHKVGLIGTIQNRIGDDRIPTLHTTPEAPDFQRLLATMVVRGADIVVCEVSSHALRLGRVDASWFEVAAFTNLTRDHLDFHDDMEDYYQAKASLFDRDRAGRAVIWLDDPAGERLAAEIEIPVITVGTTSEAQVRVLVHATRLTGSTFELREATPGGVLDGVVVDVPLPGSFNTANAAIAAVCAREIGYRPDSIVAGLAEPTVIPGRFEIVSGQDPVTVVVDYAHTPASVAGMIEAVRPLVDGQVICVFGAGGDRDQDKRSEMGRAASQADAVIVTSDNPRSEAPDAIIDQVLEGLVGHGSVTRITDRAAAIDRAIRTARDGDCVLILGKGHERGQEVDGRTIPFDDRITATTALQNLRATS